MKGGSRLPNHIKHLDDVVEAGFDDEEIELFEQDRNRFERVGELQVGNLGLPLVQRAHQPRHYRAPVPTIHRFHRHFRAIARRHRRKLN